MCDFVGLWKETTTCKMVYRSSLRVSKDTIAAENRGIIGDDCANIVAKLAGEV